MSKSLPLPVRRVLREPLDQGALDAAYTRFRLTPRPAASQRAAVGIGVTVLAAAVAALAFLAVRSAAGPLRLANGVLPEQISEPRVELSDGSVIELDRSTRLETLENDGQRFTLIEHEGRAVFDVVPGGPRRWTIECGLATVSVVGTRFAITRTPSRVEVSVERGAVLVRGPLVENGVRRLGAGNALVVDGPTAASAPATDAIVDVPMAPTLAAVPLTAEPTAPSSRVHLAAPVWRALAERGEYDEAYAALGDDGVERVARAASATELLELADVARLSGHPAEAVEPLELLLREHTDDPNAGLAAFTLGRVEHDALANSERAARAFEQALSLTLPAPLVPDAWARLAQARSETGDASAARTAAEHYLSLAPDGARARAMRAVVEAPR